jgi:membrane protein
MLSGLVGFAQRTKDELRAAVRLFRARGGRLLSGAVAFCALLSVVPMMIVVMQVASALTNEEAARSTLAHELTRWVGASGSSTVLGLTDGMHERLVARSFSLEALWSRLGAFALLIYGCTRLGSQLQRALDILWDAPQVAEHGGAKAAIVRQLRKRSLSLLVVVVGGLVIAGLAIGHSVLSRLHLMAENLDGQARLSPSRALASIGSFLATVCLFFVVMQTLPSKKMPVLATLRGAVVTSLLFTLGAVLVGIYVAHKAATSVFGTATSIVMLLVWVYYSAHVFFLGAAYTRVHAEGMPKE